MGRLLRLLSFAFLSSISGVFSQCISLNSCSGHGSCDVENQRCNCYSGYGASSDIATYRSPDCSMRSCPADRAWVDIATGPLTAHNLAECSNQGLCDRSTGRCRCFAGYEGEACQRSACPGSPACSGHGKCVSIGQMASEANAEPIGQQTVYGGDPEGATWDADKIQGCVCDSAWAVGYGASQTQVPQWLGADCSQQRCPSGDDPRTPDVNEVDCQYKDENGKIWRGIIGSDGKNYPAGTLVLPPGVRVEKEASCTPGVNCGGDGNLCYVPCSKRGSCDYATGLCACFPGYYGQNCGVKSVI